MSGAESLNSPGKRDGADCSVRSCQRACQDPLTRKGGDALINLKYPSIHFQFLFFLSIVRYYGDYTIFQFFNIEIKYHLSFPSIFDSLVYPLICSSSLSKISFQYKLGGHQFDNH